MLRVAAVSGCTQAISSLAGGISGFDCGAVPSQGTFRSWRSLGVGERGRGCWARCHAGELSTSRGKKTDFHWLARARARRQEMGAFRRGPSPRKESPTSPRCGVTGRSGAPGASNSSSPSAEHSPSDAHVPLPCVCPVSEPSVRTSALLPTQRQVLCPALRGRDPWPLPPGTRCLASGSQTWTTAGPQRPPAPGAVPGRLSVCFHRQ